MEICFVLSVQSISSIRMVRTFIGLKEIANLKANIFNHDLYYGNLKSK
ncbi:hypothetical protein ACFOG5_01435 [Pedobacter fastidiosus]